MKRLFAAAFTAVTLATLATVSLSQSAFAAVADETLLEDMEPVSVEKGEYRETITNGTISTMYNGSAIYMEFGTIGTINNVKIDLDYGDDYDVPHVAGIYNESDNSGGTITTISDVDIQVSGPIYAYGIYNDRGTITTISNVDIQAYSSDGYAYGFYNAMKSTPTITSFSGNITATTDSGIAIALSYIGNSKSSDYTFNFNGDTSLTATATDGGTAYALLVATVQSLTLTADSADITITLTGGITSSGVPLILGSGTYVLAGDSTTIKAGSLSISSGASLTLTGETTFNITDNALTLNLSDINLSELVDVDSVISSALLTIESGTSISGLDSINIVLGENDSASWNEDLLRAIISDDTSVLGGVSYTVYSGSVGGTEIASGEFTVIPEPSTATLSFLALAGLCARRRRQA